ncbi:oligosaccharide flippase family protein [Knoellia sp. DB2414S]|uniref:Oligosaccharide flippase family protein n=1 Tax=Knoellia koreensis TaxID=2730921 RepID=A0A849H7F6_9MICO|nr:oligosaccharide flippase family protein [Knoellia sp. DB2414S]
MVALALAPVLTRVFDPTSFGAFSTVMATASLMVGFSSFRFELLAQRVPRETGESLFRLALWSILAVGLVVTGASFVAWKLGAEPIWLMCGALGVAGSVPLVSSAIATWESRYRWLASMNFAQGALTPIAQITLGLASATGGALAAGFTVARLGWLINLRALRGSGEAAPAPPARLHDILRLDVLRFGLIGGASALVNAAASQAPILLVAFLYGHTEAGLFAMAFRLIVAPLGLVAQAASGAVVGEVGRSVRERRSGIHELISHAMRDLAMLGLAPAAAAALLAPYLAPRILGEAWADTGWLISALAVGALAQLVAAPFGQVLILTHHQRWLLIWDVLRLTLTCAALVIPRALGWPVLAGVGALSLGQAVMYGALVALVRQASRSHDTDSGA